MSLLQEAWKRLEDSDTDAFEEGLRKAIESNSSNRIDIDTKKKSIKLTRQQKRAEVKSQT
jgi:hypothetical protein